MATLAQNIELVLKADDQISSKLKSLSGTAEESLGESSPKGLGSIASKATLAVAAIGTAAVTAGAALLKAADDAAATGDKWDKMAARTGLTAESLSSLEFAASQSGTSMEAVEGALVKLSRRMVGADQGSVNFEQAFKTLGVDIKTASGEFKAADTVFLEIADSIKTMGVDTETTNAVTRAMGVAATDLIPLLQQGGSGIEALQQQADALGITFSTANATMGAEFVDAKDQLTRALGAATDKIGLSVMPVLTDLAEGFVSIVTEVNSWTSVMDGIGTLASGWMTTIGTFAGDALDALADIFRVDEGETGSAFSNALSTIFFNVLAQDGPIVGFFNLWSGYVGAFASTLWAPISAAITTMFDVAKENVITGINAVAEEFTGGINTIIEKVNTIAGVFGEEIDLIDWEPLTVAPAKSFSENMDTATEEVKGKWDELGTKTKDFFASQSAEAFTANTTMKALSGDTAKKATEDLEAIGSSGKQAYGDIDSAAFVSSTTRKARAVETKKKEEEELKIIEGVGLETYGAVQESAAEAARKQKEAIEEARPKIVQEMKLVGTEGGGGLVTAADDEVTSPTTGLNANLTTALQNINNGSTARTESLNLGQMFGQTMAEEMGTQLPPIVDAHLGLLKSDEDILKSNKSSAEKLGGLFGNHFGPQLPPAVNNILTSTDMNSFFSNAGRALGGAFGGPMGAEIGAIVGPKVSSILGNASRSFASGLKNTFEGVFGKGKTTVAQAQHALDNIAAGAKSAAQQIAAIKASQTTDNEASAAAGDFDFKKNDDPTGFVPSAKQVSSVSQAELYLQGRIPGSISRKQLLAFGGSEVRKAVTNLSATMGAMTPTLKGLLIQAASGGVASPVMFLQHGITLKAAQGLNMMVNRPTTFMAGEAGPEHVQVTPRGRDAPAVGNKQIFVNFTVNALDLRRSNNEGALEELADVLIDKLRDKSELGIEIIHNRGIIQEVAV